MTPAGRLPLPLTSRGRRERARMVAAIARRVAAGTYRVRAERVAEAMLGRAPREAP